MAAHWNKSQAKSIAKDIMRRAGNGWNLLGRELQIALVDSAVLSVLRGQMSDCVIMPDAINELTLMTLKAAGLEEE